MVGGLLDFEYRFDIVFGVRGYKKYVLCFLDFICILFCWEFCMIILFKMKVLIIFWGR